MPTPNSLILLATVTATGNSPGIQPFQYDTTKNSFNFYVWQINPEVLTSPTFTIQFSFDNVDYFDLQTVGGPLCQFAGLSVRGGNRVFPQRLNPDVWLRVVTTGDLGSNPNVELFIG